MNNKFDIKIESETGKLQGVVIHTPGSEVENMTPENAERALYSDILNLSVAKREYDFFENILKKTTTTFQVTDLLEDILKNEKVRSGLINKICAAETDEIRIKKDLLDLTSRELCRFMIEGVVMKKDNLSKFLNRERYSLKPLHNFFFTRDSAAVILDTVLINKMKNRIRRRESIIMESIFDYHPLFNTSTISTSADDCKNTGISMEGGDIQVINKNTILIGIGSRTSAAGVDFIINHFKATKQKINIIVQELPLKPESFIHLDMVFTVLSSEYCMVYEPVITKPNKYQTIHISIENGSVNFIKNEKNILQALKKLGVFLNPVPCGGDGDPWIQEREQWHSGTNFFAIDDGVVLGYARNVHTIESLAANGFDILSANEFLKNDIEFPMGEKTVITLEGSELPRGGGGCRCMTMPIKRDPLH